MSRDPREIAQELVISDTAHRWRNGECGDGTLAEEIAAAIERDRAEMIERCAKVAEANAPRNEPGRYWDGRFAAADEIRALLPSPPSEGQP